MGARCLFQSHRPMGAQNKQSMYSNLLDLQKTLNLGHGCAISSDRCCQAWLVGFDGIMYDANDFSEVDWYPSELRIGVSPEGKISERMTLLGGSSQLISG